MHSYIKVRFFNGRREGKNIEMFSNCIKESLKGKVVMYSTLEGNIVMIEVKKWDKINYEKKHALVKRIESMTFWNDSAVGVQQEIINTILATL